jgi:hypothetical protein
VPGDHRVHAGADHGGGAQHGHLKALVAAERTPRQGLDLQVVADDAGVGLGGDGRVLRQRHRVVGGRAVHHRARDEHGAADAGGGAGGEHGLGGAPVVGAAFGGVGVEGEVAAQVDHDVDVGDPVRQERIANVQDAPGDLRHVPAVVVDRHDPAEIP